VGGNSSAFFNLYVCVCDQARLMDTGYPYWSVYRHAQKQTESDLLEIRCQSDTESIEGNASPEIYCDDSIDTVIGSCWNPPAELPDDSSVTHSQDSDGSYESCSSPVPSLSDSASHVSSSSVVHDDDGDFTPSLSEQLAQWISDFQVSHIAVNKLLQILKPHCPPLPHDVRTLLQTPRHTEVKVCGSGEYVHFGLEKGINHALLKNSIADGEEIYVQINVDGLPVFKSSNRQFWPILCLIRQPYLTDPFVVGLFSGTTKPPVGFLDDFVYELKMLMTNGMPLDMNHVSIKLHSFVCDAPARAFLKCIKLHSGYSSCEKCDQHGEWLGKVIFSSTEGSLRTDELFRNRTDDGHHLPLLESPLLALDMDMVTQFPLDPMHLLHLGVMRRLLLSWLRGPLTVRVASRVVSELSASLLTLSTHIPHDFCRRPRSLAEIDRWKATEFRLLLLYCGPVVLRTALKEPLYKHFLLLFVASTVLSSKHLSHQFCQYAGGLLKSFVQGVAELYGKTELVYNMHGLLHLASDVARYGSLDNFSSYPFENKLKEVKRLVRKPHHALQQVARRLAETQKCFSGQSQSALQQTKFLHEHCTGPVPDGFEKAKQFSKLLVNGMQLSVGQRDSCVQLLDKSVVVVRNILQVDTTAVILCSKFETVSDFFVYPLPSSCINIFRVSQLDRSYHCAHVDEITHKSVLLTDQSDFVVFPLLHT